MAQAAQRACHGVYSSVAQPCLGIRPELGETSAKHPSSIPLPLGRINDELAMHCFLVSVPEMPKQLSIVMFAAELRPMGKGFDSPSCTRLGRLSCSAAIQGAQWTSMDTS